MTENITPEQHVLGVKPSNWISTSLDPTVAMRFAGSNGQVAAIDPARLTTRTVWTGSGEGLSSQFARDLARQEEEVLVDRVIVPSAIISINIVP